MLYNITNYFVTEWFDITLILMNRLWNKASCMREIKQLYEDYKHDVFRYVLSLAKDVHVAEDICSEVFLSGIKQVAFYRGDADIKTWLFSIARYKWYAHLRKNKKDVSLEGLAEIHFSDAVNIESIVEKGMLIERILEYLKEQPIREQKIMMMRIEGYSFAEIAKEVNITESSARVINHRTREKIKTKFGEER